MVVAGNLPVTPPRAPCFPTSCTTPNITPRSPSPSRAPSTACRRVACTAPPRDPPLTSAQKGRPCLSSAPRIPSTSWFCTPHEDAPLLHHRWDARRHATAVWTPRPPLVPRHPELIHIPTFSAVQPMRRPLGDAPHLHHRCKARRPGTPHPPPHHTPRRPPPSGGYK